MRSTRQFGKFVAFQNGFSSFFGEFLLLDEVRLLEKTNKDVWDMLMVFAFGSLSDLPATTSLSEPLTLKLKQLTLISMATRDRRISYDTLGQELKLDSDHAVEELVIDAIYKGLIKGRLNGCGRYVEVEEWQARDLHPDKIAEIRKAFDSSLQNVGNVVAESQAMAKREEALTFSANFEEEARNICIQKARAEVEEEMRSVGPPNYAPSRPSTSTAGFQLGPRRRIPGQKRTQLSK
ncbi:unnamed protein product, partial [Mesorhabditis spiculigera]